jgi:hypothetical protein
MMSREKAAQYFIVAWVKEWTLRTYLEVVTDGGPEIRFEHAQALYPWLPDSWPFAANHRVRTFLAEANRPLSDALWDAADNRARLALAPQVEAFVCTSYSRAYVEEARSAASKAQSRMNVKRLLIKADIEDKRRKNGYHWQVCK